MTLRINGATSGYTEIDAPATAGNNTLVLPTGNGSSDQVLTTDGSGALGWVNAGPKLYYRLASDFTGTNTATAQSLFGVGVAVEANCLYRFNGYFWLSKSAGSLTHSVGTLFAGTAIVSAIGYQAQGSAIGGALPAVSTNYAINFGQSTAVLQVTQTAGSATLNAVVHMQGSVSFSAAGTFIPQYQLSAAPGGAYTTKTGAFFEMTKVSASGANSQGTWS